MGYIVATVHLSVAQQSIGQVKLQADSLKCFWDKDTLFWRLCTALSSDELMTPFNVKLRCMRNVGLGVGGFKN